MGRIDDRDLLLRLSRIEGRTWGAAQRRAQDAYAVNTFRKAFAILRSEAGGAIPDDFDPVDPGVVGLPAGDGAIYGESGHTRYLVRNTGEVVALIDNGNPKADKARRLGFTVRSR